MPAPTYRPGPLGALMDEYERTISEFSHILGTLSQEAFEALRDRTTSDDDCRSIQTVTAHVVRSGYGYVNYMRGAFGEDFPRPEIHVASPSDGQAQLSRLATVTAETFEGRWQTPNEALEAMHIQSRWGPVFNLEQMFEHAIVHVLRHRRQVERFLGEPRFQPTGR